MAAPGPTRGVGVADSSVKAPSVQTSVLVQRLSYGLLAIAVAFAFVAADGLISYFCDWGPPWGTLLRHGSVMPLACAVLLPLAALELFKLMEAVGLRPLRRWAAVTCGVMMLTPWLSAGQILTSYSFASDGLRWTVIVCVVSFLGSVCILVFRRRIDGAIGTIAATWAAILYLGLFPSFAMQLRCSTSVPGFYGAWVLMFFLAVTKASDVGAYLVGSALGRHKLIPAVSPAKSVEGAMGALGLSVAVSLILSTYAPDLTGEGSGFTFLTTGQAVIFGIAVSLFAQVGDLFESVLKRDAQIKDSGRVIPSFGGILDLVDSPAITAPIAWLLLAQWWGVV